MMRFKIDENLPAEFADVLNLAGHDAKTVVAQGMKGKDDRSVLSACRRERRILVTLDQEFGNVRSYPPKEHCGIIVMNSLRQDKRRLLRLLRRLIPLLQEEPVEGRLWIVEERRVRIRAEEGK